VLLAGCGSEPRYGSTAQLAESLDCDHKAVYDGTAGDEDDGVALGTCEQYEGTQLVLLVAADEATLDWTTLSDAFVGSYPLHLARDAADPTRVVAATGDGRLMTSTTGGREWATLAVPAS